MSNLLFISKLIERVVADQPVKHLDNNLLVEPFQSAYWHHLTETALVHVSNDILLFLDRQQANLLVLLDLSMALDTVDHEVLHARLSSSISLSGTVVTGTDPTSPAGPNSSLLAMDVPCLGGCPEGSHKDLWSDQYSLQYTHFP